MAKAKRVPSPTTVVLELTDDEAQVLCEIIGWSIIGSSTNSRRRFTDSI